MISDHLLIKLDTYTSKATLPGTIWCWTRNLGMIAGRYVSGEWALCDYQHTCRPKAWNSTRTQLGSWRPPRVAAEEERAKAAIVKSRAW